MTCHPGFAVRFRDGSWLAYGHGWHIFDASHARIARVFASDNEACLAVAEAAEDYAPGAVAGMHPEVVVAWEVECAKLRAKVEELQAANMITPKTLDAVEESLRDALRGIGRES